jgi:hypothetical protein
MQTRDIHRAIEGLLGASVSFSSVKNCLARKSVGKAPQFERIGPERRGAGAPDDERPSLMPMARIADVRRERCQLPLPRDGRG